MKKASGPALAADTVWPFPEERSRPPPRCAGSLMADIITARFSAKSSARCGRLPGGIYRPHQRYRHSPGVNFE